MTHLLRSIYHRALWQRAVRASIEALPAEDRLSLYIAALAARNT